MTTRKKTGDHSPKSRKKVAKKAGKTAGKTVRKASKKPAPGDALGSFRAASKADVNAVIKGMHELYPDADCELDWNNPLELLIATILSAQSTDKRVNVVGKELFKKYPDVHAFAAAPPEEFEIDIKSTGFYRQKTKNVLKTANLIVEQFDGEVPQTLDDLVSLPGVARKTANVVLGTAFKKATGVVVDTHVKRLAYRIGFTSETDPIKVERALMDQLPVAEWIFVAHALIWHGRRVCDARKPDCGSCLIAAHCARNGLP